MAILIVDHRGIRQAGTLNGRVLIGRWPQNTIIVDDRSVSRIHAWVGVQHDEYYIADAGSRTGTLVNGQALSDRHVLVEGDHIQIGPAVLYYETGNALPPEADEIDLTPRSPEELTGTHGNFMDCECGAPLWLPVAFTGVGQCRYCGHMVKMRGPVAHPGPPPVPPELPAVLKMPAAAMPSPVKRKPPAPPAISAPPVPVPRADEPAPVAQETACGACHSPITVFDEVATCPSCGLMFHADCWKENRGCSSYGCEQVGVLERA